MNPAPDSAMIHTFGCGRDLPGNTGPERLGGKGSSLVAMSRAELPVPPGLVITIPCCAHVLEHGGSWPPGLEEALRVHLEELEQATGRRFGAGPEPLLVSVRSGAARSMPGMMDTILNAGLHPGLAEEVPDRAQFWSVYQAFVRQFGRTVAGIPDETFDEAAAAAGGTDGADDGKAAAEACLRVYREHRGADFPDSPWKTLCACIDAVFASWKNERAVIYRRAHGLQGLAGTAVTVQAMFNSDVSGITFTANPSAPDAEQMVIESAYGLGESIVSGDVTPDRFVVDRRTRKIVEREIGRKESVLTGLGSDAARSCDPEAPSLTGEQIDELVALALRVEDFFGHPVDIEWGWSGGRFTLLQSRAIRGLEGAREAEKVRQEEIARLRGQAEEAGGVALWVAHNLGETLDLPTPMSWDLVGGFMTGEGGFGRMYRDLGYRPSRRVRREGFLELIAGRVYAAVDRASELFWEGMPLVYDPERVIRDPRLLESAPADFDTSRTDSSFLLRLPGTLWAMARSARLTRRARREALEHFENGVLPPYLAYVESEARRDLTTLPTEELVAELGRRRARVLDTFGKESLKPGFFGGLARGELEGLLAQVLGDREGTRLTGVLCSGLEDSTVLQNRMLYEVAQGAATLGGFIEAYGHRAVGEMELARPRWDEEPAYVEQMIEVQRGLPPEQGPASRHEVLAQQRREAMETLLSVLAEAGAGFLAGRVTELAEESRRLLPYRETGKHYLLMGMSLLRRVLVELGRRWEIHDDVFFLTLEDLPRFEARRGEMLEQIAARRLRREACRRLDLPEMIDSRDLENLGRPRELPSSDSFEGVSLSPGVITGTVRLVRDPAKAGKLPDDCILLCTSTDPAWTALFTMVKGLVVERGGVLSHGAITARDFGIPAVACRDATRLIADGARVRVEGDRGRISVLET